MTKATVGKWRARFIDRHDAGLYDVVRLGPPHTAFFVEKLRDVAGLHLSPPKTALVLCVDGEKRCQALECTPPMLPMGFVYGEGVTHDYKRHHRTTTPFAALNLLNLFKSAVLATCTPRHRHQDFLMFLREIGKAVPIELDVRCIVHNYATHSHPKINASLESRPRRHIYFIPTYGSWLNQDKRLVALIADKATGRDSFTSVKQLVQRFNQFVTHHKTNSHLFHWTATANCNSPTSTVIAPGFAVRQHLI